MATALGLRIGHGYDLHRLEPRPPKGQGRPLVLAGIRFDDHPTGPISHSDGDAVYHAITDAILGALGQPDIGQLFPENEPHTESANSAAFVREASVRLRGAGYAVGNLDITVICEKPRLGPHKKQMIANIARELSCDPAQVNIKGKTHEKVDAVGEGRAIEAHAVALLLKTDSAAKPATA